MAFGCGRPRPENRAVLPDKVLDFDKLFQQNCAGCHGAEGKWGPAPPLNDVLFLAIVPADEIQRVGANGREGTLMAPFSHGQGGPLTERQVEVVAAGIRAHWSRPAEKLEPPPPPYLLSAAPKGDKAAGARLFAQVCAACHGNEGQGGDQPGDAGPLRSVAFLGLISNQALRRIVITGRPDLGMPDYRGLGEKRPGGKPLNSGEVADVVALLDSWRLKMPPQGEKSPASSPGAHK